MRWPSLLMAIKPTIPAAPLMVCTPRRISSKAGFTSPSESNSRMRNPMESSKPSVSSIKPLINSGGKSPLSSSSKLIWSFSGWGFCCPTEEGSSANAVCICPTHSRISRRLSSSQGDSPASTMSRNSSALCAMVPTWDMPTMLLAPRRLCARRWSSFKHSEGSSIPSIC